MADKRPLLSLDEALSRLLQGAAAQRITDTETVSTFDALGRVLAQAVESRLDVPPADNTSMDGYAVHAADVVASGTVLPVLQRIPAGVVGGPLPRGAAARIFTGAQVPAGATAVVMQEQCEALPDAADAGRAGPAAAAGGEAGARASANTGLGQVRINTVPEAGQWIRRRGEDVAQGAVVLQAGARLTPQALGLAASVGAGSLTVCRRPRVALFSTGDELAMPGEVLKPGAIYNSNRFTLRGLLQAAGCEVDDLGIVPDRLDATIDALRQAAVHNDLILSCGGVSAGDEDHIRPAVEAQGWIENWQVALKPGKPLAYGGVHRRAGVGAGAGAAAGPGDTAMFLGLPGNPVSSFVNFLIAVAPVLRVLQGAPAGLPAGLPLRADFDWPRPDRRREFLRVRLNAAGGLDLFANQSSGVLTSAVWADGLVDNPAGQAVRQGDSVRFLPFAQLLAG